MSSILVTGEGKSVKGQPDRGWPRRGRLHFEQSGDLRFGVLVLVLTSLVGPFEFKCSLSVDLGVEFDGWEFDGWVAACIIMGMVFP